MSPRVSVVMPAYNHRRFVGQAIASVLDQSFRDFELLVVDDGSTDGTPNVIRQFQDVRLMLEVFPANRGAVVAENTAIRSSRGEYIAILNSDDYFLPGKLETQVNFLDANPAVAAVFSGSLAASTNAAPRSRGSLNSRLAPASSSRGWSGSASFSSSAIFFAIRR